MADYAGVVQVGHDVGLLERELSVESCLGVHDLDGVLAVPGEFEFAQSHHPLLATA